MRTGPAPPACARERLIVALDTPRAAEAMALIRAIGEEVAWVKVGLELFCSEGPQVVEEIARLGKRIFLDLKLHDIPTTVAGAIRAVGRLPVDLVNVHGSAGPETMEAAARAAGEHPRLGVLAVTRLTSDARGGGDFRDVEEIARLALDAGLHGIVCPAPAAALARQRFGERLRLVCPGIRPAGIARDDQVHVATPSEAVRSGADWIVVGRAVSRASDPAAAVRGLLEDIGDG